MKNRCAARQTQSAETERAEQLHCFPGAVFHSVKRSNDTKEINKNTVAGVRPRPAPDRCHRRSSVPRSREVRKCVYPPEWNHYSVKIVLK